MKNQKLTYALSLCMALAVGACQEEAVPAKGPVADGPEGILTLTLGGDASMTKAVGDYVPDGVTTQEEKEVRSLALFVKTDASAPRRISSPALSPASLARATNPRSN